MSLPTSDVPWLPEEPVICIRALNGRPVDAPREWEPMLVEVMVPAEEWHDTRLQINGVTVPLTLRRVDGATRVIAEWERCGPGHYAIEVAAPSRRGRLSLAVASAKIAEDELQLLIEDLEERLPAGIAVGLQRAGGLTELADRRAAPMTVAAEIERLRHAIQGAPQEAGLTDVLASVARDPHTRLTSRLEWVRRDRARRPAPTALRAALTRAGNLTADRQPTAVADTRVESSLDLYENRLLRTFLVQIERRLRRLQRTVAMRGNASLTADVAALAQAFQQAKRAAPFLADVRELGTAPRAITMVLLRRPDYRTLFERYIAFQRGISIRLESPTLASPLDSLPLLYQLWGTLHVIDTVLVTCVEEGYQLVLQRLIRRDAGGFYVRPLPHGEPALLLRHPLSGKTVRVIPERTYGTAAAGLHATTYPQRPDVAVEIGTLEGGERVLLFDPKYKADGPAESGPDSLSPLKPDIDKMHTYRDAIHDAEGNRVVHSASTLYPGRTVVFSGGIAALSARPRSVEQLRKEIAGQLRDAL